MNRVVARSLVLPAILAVRREPVYRWHRHLLDCEALDEVAYAEYRLRKLTAIVAHAEKSSPFYRERFAECGVRAADVQCFGDIARLPILAKSDLAALRQSVKRQGVIGAPLVVRKTAGSSGDPAVVYADANASALSLAARVRAYGWHGIGLGDKELRFWGRPLSSGVWGSRIKDTLLNRMQVDSQRLSECAWEDTLARIRRFSPDYAYGYTSLLSLFGECLRDGGTGRRGFDLKAAICTSETSTRMERVWIGDALGCQVLNEYGCSETDIIAFECPSGGLHVIGENVFVEVINEGGGPAEHGEVVITDLNNQAMPLIRYRIGDIGVLSRRRCSCGRRGPCFEEIVGRVQGQYLVAEDGTKYHSQTIAYMFENLVHGGLHIRRFKVVQESRRFVRIMVATDALSEIQVKMVRQQLEAEFGRLAGGQFVVAVEFVRDRELIQLGSKYRHFESLVSGAS